MDQIKVGKFIQQLRKGKNITQEQLAEKLFLNSRSISKWERGENLPDIENIKKLSEIFEVSQEEIMNGERKKTKKEKIKEKLKSFLKKYKLIIIPFILINIILYILLAIFFINNYNKVTIYDVRTEGEDFYVEGTITVGKKFTYIDLFNIKLPYETNIDEIYYIQYSILSDDEEYILTLGYDVESEDEKMIAFDINEGLVYSSIHSREENRKLFVPKEKDYYYQVSIYTKENNDIEYKEKIIFSKIES